MGSSSGDGSGSESWTKVDRTRVAALSHNAKLAWMRIDNSNNEVAENRTKGGSHSNTTTTTTNNNNNSSSNSVSDNNALVCEGFDNNSLGNEGFVQVNVSDSSHPSLSQDMSGSYVYVETQRAFSGTHVATSPNSKDYVNDDQYL